MAAPSRPSPEQLLALLQAAIEGAPAFRYGETLTDEELRWLGRADALLEAAGAMTASINFRVARGQLGGYSHSRSNLLIPLHDAYSKIELMAPAAAQGSFIAGGDTWNGYASLVRLMQRDCDDLLIVDPYLNAAIYTDLAPHAKAKVAVRCLTAKRPENHAGLLAASNRWASDGISANVSLAVRYAPAKALHDRLIIIDRSEVWLISQSLKDIAQRSPASISRAESELGAMKVQHYESLWPGSDHLS